MILYGWAVISYHIITTTTTKDAILAHVSLQHNKIYSLSTLVLEAVKK